MNYRYLPVCFHPTTLVMVDDDKVYLEGIAQHFMGMMKLHTFNKPMKALEFLQNDKRSSFTETCITQPENDSEERDIQIDISKIHEHIFNPDRFNEISTLIVDFSMPHLNGSQLCEKLKNTPFKKLMLTGEATNAEGIKAMNNDWINRFYTKGGETLGREIRKHILELSIQYFQDLSQIITKSIADSPLPPPNAILDEALVEPVFEKLTAKNIYEYYLFSNEGYFLTSDPDGNLGWMVIHSEEEMDSLNEQAADLLDSDPSSNGQKVVDALTNRTSTLLFADIEESNKPLEKWHSHLVDVEKITTPTSDYYIGFAQYEPGQLEQDIITPFYS